MIVRPRSAGVYVVMKSPITDTDEDREQFLKYEFFDWTIRGAFGRGNVYEKTAGDTERGNLHEALRSSLERLIPRYGVAVSDDDDDEYHIQNIVDLSKELSEKHAGVLNDKCFRIGTAQKALNLYLKYLWCVGKVLRPPHCPFDANIIGKLKLPSNTCRTWTQLKDIEDYKKWVVAAKAEAGGTPLAVWELRLSNNDYR